MPLHLLGKKSWNVYNADNIARVKADEAAAAAREAAREQRMQEIDAARRAAILRGQTPPPLPDEEESHNGSGRDPDCKHSHDRKRRKLAGEDDTDRDIRLAASHRDGHGEAESADSRVVKLRKPTSDAPLTDHAGNIDLFPVDLKEQLKREKNEEAEREKQKKERALEDQYTMRFSNAAGRGGMAQQPWYTSSSRKTDDAPASSDQAIAFPTLENKNVWGNEDPLRKEREQSRITSSDPFAFMQRAQAQLKKSKDDKKKWAEERERELMELRAAQERSDRRERHVKRKKRVEDDGHHGDRERREKRRSSSHRHRHGSRSRSRERRHEADASHRHRESECSRSSAKGRERDRTSHASSHRHGRRASDREERGSDSRR